MESSEKSHEELQSENWDMRFWIALVFQIPFVMEACKERKERARMFELLEGMLDEYMKSEVIEDLREMCNLEKSRDEPSQPTRTPTTTGGKHVAGAKSAGSGETTPQAPVRPETQPATLPEAGGTGEETLAFSRNQPVFDSMRMEEEKNFALLPVYSHQMERSNPTLFLTKQKQAKMEEEEERKQTKLKELQTEIERIPEKLKEEPLSTASQPTRTPTTTGEKHITGAKSAGSGETTPQAPARPATQPATLSAAGGTGEETSLAFLRNQPEFESMRTEMIIRNPQQFISMLNETGGESGEGGGGAPEGRSSGEGVIHVTQGEKEFIDRTKQHHEKMREEEGQHAQLQIYHQYSASTTSPAIGAALDMAGDRIGCMVDSPTSSVFGDTMNEDFCAIYEAENVKAQLEEDPVDFYNLEKNVSTRGIPSQNVEKECDKIGCKISSEFLPQKHGTLGGFVGHPKYGLCGITCAHVVLDDKLKFELKEKVNVKENEMDPCKLFQPSFDFQNKNVIGKLVEVIYKEGGKGTAGVDLALFKLEQRLPTEGNFPNYQGANTSIRYVSGNVWGKSGIPSNESEVQKFGFVTGLTYGRIQFDNAAVREISFHSDMKVDTKQFTTTLYKQYHIKSNDEKHEFSKQGDSGALVFIKDLGEENDLRCIGMVEAVLTDGTCAVTPITAILEALHVTQLKSFLPNITWEKIDRRLEEMEDRLKKHISSRTTDAPENAAKARKNPSQ